MKQIEQEEEKQSQKNRKKGRKLQILDPIKDLQKQCLELAEEKISLIEQTEKNLNFQLNTLANQIGKMEKLIENASCENSSPTTTPNSVNSQPSKSVVSLSQKRKDFKKLGVKAISKRKKLWKLVISP